MLLNFHIILFLFRFLLTSFFDERFWPVNLERGYDTNLKNNNNLFAEIKRVIGSGASALKEKQSKNKLKPLNTQRRSGFSIILTKLKHLTRNKMVSMILPKELKKKTSLYKIFRKSLKY